MPHSWTRTRLYLSSFFFLTPLRAAVFFVMCMTAVPNLYIALIGYDRRKPMRGLRLLYVRFLFIFYTRVGYGLIYFLPYIRHTYVDYDYSPYLGPDYRKEMPKEAPTLINNHSHFLDIPTVVASGYLPTYFAKKTVQQFPFFGKVADAIQTLYVDRAGTKEEQEKVMEKIRAKQQSIIDSDFVQPCLSINPEGTETNGRVMLPFRKGAFGSLLPVRPQLFNYWAPMY